jgi:hypothetical protein
VTRSPAPAQDDPRAQAVFGPSAWRVGLAIGAVTLVITISGLAPTPEAKLQWVLSDAVGFGAGIIAARWLVPWTWWRDRLWAAALLIGGVASAPIAATVVACLVLLRHQPLTLGLAAGVLPSVLGSSLVLTGLAFLVRRNSGPPAVTAAGPAEAKFMARLPEKLRGAELFAVEAEDHYLRLHTSLGQDLILMRLADAIAELDGLEGAQTHRSWWVARAAVVRTERLDGRAALTLKNGAEAPVSRGFAKALRAAGWF